MEGDVAQLRVRLSAMNVSPASKEFQRRTPVDNKGAGAHTCTPSMNRILRVKINRKTSGQSGSFWHFREQLHT